MERAAALTEAVGEPDLRGGRGGATSARPAAGAGSSGRTGGGDSWKFSDPVPTPAKAFASEVPEGLAAGVMVAHAKFGQGVIVSTRGEGDDFELTVRFEEAWSKTLLAKYASLAVI